MYCLLTKQNHNLLNALRSVMLCFVCGILFSCAGGEVRDEDGVETTSRTMAHLDVDSDVESDFERGATLLQEEKYTEAIEIFKTVIDREKRLPAPFVNIAIAYNKTGDIKAAEENLIHALKLDITHPVANNELGMLYRKAGKFKAARVAYENAIKAHSDYLPAKRNLGVLCDIYMHDYNCALEQFESYLALNPDDKTVSIWVVDVKSRLGK